MPTKNLNPAEFIEAMKKTSLLNWFRHIPWKDIHVYERKLKYEVFTSDLNQVPYPKTIIVSGKWYEVDSKRDDIIFEVSNRFLYFLRKLVNKHIGKYPVFIRGDYGSSKFQWCRTCYVENELFLRRNILNLLYEESGINDNPVNALIVREYVEPYKIFDVDLSYKERGCRFPIALEVRTYVSNGKPIGWTRYWVKDAVKHNWSCFNALPEDWENIYDEKYVVSQNDLNIILESVRLIISNPYLANGGWSIDFMKGADGIWYFIDMADSRVSWFPDKLNSFNEVSSNADEYNE